eukprot:TRINITY_DN22172_c0_g1_i1.p1 TRINITY_DN22172_c0_g1~~TRINITY_DN22172_c0_g1_i1.p1  ORF type:complete len:146 (+),score=45.26 TRINITY_DN22172_c0_g1_i1:96-533(+)
MCIRDSINAEYGSAKQQQMGKKKNKSPSKTEAAGAAAEASSPGLASVEEGDCEIDDSAVEFIKTALVAEVERLDAMGQKVLPLSVKNCSVCTRDDEAVLFNRVEVDTKFDFTKVTRILVAPAEDFPAKPGYSYCHVVLILSLIHI